MSEKYSASDNVSGHVRNGNTIVYFLLYLPQSIPGSQDEGNIMFCL